MKNEADDVVDRIAAKTAARTTCVTPGCNAASTHFDRCATCFRGAYRSQPGFADPPCFGEVVPCPCSLVHRRTLPRSGSDPYSGPALCGSPWGRRVAKAQYGSRPYDCVTCSDCRAMIARFGEPTGEPIVPGARCAPGPDEPRRHPLGGSPWIVTSGGSRTSSTSIIGADVAEEAAQYDPSPSGIQAIDFLVILAFVALAQPSLHDLVSDAIGLSKSAIAPSFHRLEALGLLRQDGEHLCVNRLALRACLEGAIRWIAPAEISEATGPGLLTADSAPPLSSKLFGGDVLVMPLSYGTSTGRMVTPLHALAPEAAARNPKLHTLLAVVDALRVGGARVRGVATEELAVYL